MNERKTLQFRFLDDFPHAGLERGAQPFQRFDPDVFTAAFDCRIVGAMHLHQFGEVFLADFERFPTTAQCCANAFGKRGAFHDATLSFASQ